MTEFTKDYRKLFNEAKEVNNYHRMSEILESVLTEAGCPDPQQNAAMTAKGKAIAEARNTIGKGPDAKKLT